MCVYIYIYIHTYILICLYICTYICTYISPHVEPMLNLTRKYGYCFIAQYSWFAKHFIFGDRDCRLLSVLGWEAGAFCFKLLVIWEMFGYSSIYLYRHILLIDDGIQFDCPLLVEPKIKCFSSLLYAANASFRWLWNQTIITAFLNIDMLNSGLVKSIITTMSNQIWF